MDKTDSKSVRRFSGDAVSVAFPLGGIGTGNVSLGARGEFRDWEIFNSPAKGNHLPYSFFAIRTQQTGEAASVRVLESQLQPPHTGATGYSAVKTAGLPRFKSSILEGRYPFVMIDFEDSNLPVTVSMEAFTPLIPLNSADSGIPGTVVRYRVVNISDKTTDVSIAGSLSNPVGMEGYDHHENLKLAHPVKNVFRQETGIQGIFFTTDKLSKKDLMYGSLSLMTTSPEATSKPCWLKGGWWDGMHDFWTDFSTDGMLETESTFDAPLSSLYSTTKMEVGSLCVKRTLQPKEETVFEFLINWYFPNRIDNWYDTSHLKKLFDKEQVKRIIKEASLKKKGQFLLRLISPRVEQNYYSRQFNDAWEAGRYLALNLDRLELKSREFTDAIFNSTLPSYVIEALVNNISVIRSPTCFRLADGTFCAFEGCYDDMGACPGNCTHVWNYAQTMAFLFPDLEQSMRKTEFLLETETNGMMNFRSMRVFDKNAKPVNDFPAIDGQLGAVIRLYRDWKLSGDDNLLLSLWEKAARALEFAFEYWDEDGDFVLESKQHNTYDIDFYGPNSHSGSLFYGALKAGMEMAVYLKDEVRAARYQTAFEEGSRKLDTLLWNGEYYIQLLEDSDAYRYQYGQGCLSDQVLGQFLANVSGLGYILPREHVKSALHSIFRYNFRNSMSDHLNVQRTFALNDEQGLLLCSWPKGGRPRLPFVYAEEVWTGVEYQVAAQLIWEGYQEEGLKIVKAVRERHDGVRRNPWNEVECGHHYARSLSSWGLLLALSGFRCDMVNQEMDINPVYQPENFFSFWSNAKAWGTYSQKIDPFSGERQWDLKVLYGELPKSMKANGKSIASVGKI